MGSTGVDVGALRAVAEEYERVCEILGRAVRDQLSHIAFGGSVAGRAHVASGEALQNALHDLTRSVSEWARAAGEIATAMDASVDRYLDADERAAGRVG